MAPKAGRTALDAEGKGVLKKRNEPRGKRRRRKKKKKKKKRKRKKRTSTSRKCSE